MNKLLSFRESDSVLSTDFLLGRRFLRASLEFDEELTAY